MEQAGKLLSSTTGNTAVNHVSTGIRFCAGYALAAYAMRVYSLWSANSPVIATMAMALGSTTTMLMLRYAPVNKDNTNVLSKTFTPLLFGATAAAMVLAAKYHAAINEEIRVYFEKHGLSRWSWTTQCSPEQISHINQLVHVKRLSLVPQLCGVIVLGVQAYSLLKGTNKSSQPKN
jgi:hypothetical protein